MTAISPTTRATIKAHLEVFTEKLVDECRGRVMPNIGNPAAYLTQQSPKGWIKPFYAAIILPEILRINEFEREYPFLSEFVPHAVAQLETAAATTKVPHAVPLSPPDDRNTKQPSPPPHKPHNQIPSEANNP